MGYLDREDIDPARTITAERERRYGRCEDDDMKIAFYLGICPEENDREEPSPLDFGNDAYRSASSYFANNLRRWEKEDKRKPFEGK